MPKKIIIITAEWDHFKDQLDALCSQLINEGINCEIKDYEDPDSLQLIIKYGINDGMVRIPQIYIINDSNVRRVNYEVTNDLRIVIKDNL